MSHIFQAIAIVLILVAMFFMGYVKGIKQGRREAVTKYIDFIDNCIKALEKQKGEKDASKPIDR